MQLSFLKKKLNQCACALELRAILVDSKKKINPALFLLKHLLFLFDQGETSQENRWGVSSIKGTYPPDNTTAVIFVKDLELRYLLCSYPN
jgi:hypothetical protein